MSDAGLAALLHLCDSLFPTGGYAHSDGLEAATAAGLVTSPADVCAWVGALLDGTLRDLEGPSICLAWECVQDRRMAELRTLDDELYAQRPCAAGRAATRAMGTRLLKTWQQLHPHAFAGEMLEQSAPGWTSPVAFATACAVVGITRRTAVEAFLYTRAAAAASAAMRLMPLGQLEAHTIVAGATDRIAVVANGILARREPPLAFSPIVDIMMMQQQYVTTRLFRS